MIDNINTFCNIWGKDFPKMIQMAQDQTIRVDMPWCTINDNTDSGDFAMRHMKACCGNKFAWLE